MNGISLIVTAFLLLYCPYNVATSVYDAEKVEVSDKCRDASAGNKKRKRKEEKKKDAKGETRKEKKRNETR
jgi:hypothetical protein